MAGHRAGFGFWQVIWQGLWQAWARPSHSQARSSDTTWLITIGLDPPAQFRRAQEGGVLCFPTQDCDQKLPWDYSTTLRGH